MNHGREAGIHMCHEEMHCLPMPLNAGVGTYSLGFFFGPGRPRSRGGALGSIDGGARFRPVPDAPPLFRLPSALGGASVLGSTASVPLGTGVAFESDDFSAVSDGCADGDGSFLMDGIAEALGGLSDGHFVSWLDGIRSDTIRLFLPGFGIDLVVVDMVCDDDDGGSGFAVALAMAALWKKR